MILTIETGKVTERKEDIKLPSQPQQFDYGMPESDNAEWRINRLRSTNAALSHASPENRFKDMGKKGNRLFSLKHPEYFRIALTTGIGLIRINFQ